MQPVSASIGEVGKIVHDPRNDRLKGVLAMPFEHRTVICRHLRHGLFAHSPVTRMSIRVAVPNISLENLRAALATLQPALAIEAVVPIEKHPWASMFLYLGWCDKQRQPSSSIKDLQAQLLLRQKERDSMPLRDDVRVERLHEPSADDIARLRDIYMARYSDYLVELSNDMIREMAASGGMFVTRNGSDCIVSVCVAEQAVIPAPNGFEPVRIVELSDAATHPDQVGNGYYSTLKHLIIRMLREELGPSVPITTEARANSLRVLRSNTGMGLRCAGYQPAHCRIASPDADVPQVGPYGDLFVFYAP